jgi:hypothetical protein
MVRWGGQRSRCCCSEWRTGCCQSRTEALYANRVIDPHTGTTWQSSLILNGPPMIDAASAIETQDAALAARIEVASHAASNG